MGLLNSRSMEDEDTISEDNATESDLTSILHFLIRSGQVRILDSDQSHFGNVPMHVPADAILDNFHQSEIHLMTRQASGIPLRTDHWNKSITDMIMRRERGSKQGQGFTRPEMCRINNNKLPHKMRIVDSYDHKAFCGIYSNDGNKLLTACQDRCIRVYDSSSGRNFPEIHQIQGRDVGWSVLDTAFTPDGRHIAYSSWSPCLHLVELNEDCSSHVALPLCPEERRFCIFSLVFSSDGHEILCGANDGHLYIYDRGANDRTLRVEGHDEDVNTVAFADNTSQIIYSGGDDGFCKVWDRRTLNEASPKPVGVLAGHMDGITYIDSRGDARYLLSNSKDQSIKLWDIRMFSTQAAQDVTRRTLGGHKWDYRWQKVPKKLVNRKTNMKGDSSVATYRGHSVLQTLIRCHFSPAFSTGQRYIYTGCAYGRVIIYDMLTGDIVSKLQGHTSCVRDVTWHPYRPEIISTSWDFSVVCWRHDGVLIGTEEELLLEEDGDALSDISKGMGGRGGNGGGASGPGGGGNGGSGDRGGSGGSAPLRRSQRIAQRLQSRLGVTRSN